MAAAIHHWMNNPAYMILGEDKAKDQLDLETMAAVNQFHHRKPKQEAEALAYSDYKRGHHAQAAAHHYRGMKAAHAAGDVEQAKKHGAMYDLHMQALGHDSWGAVPDEVMRHVNGKGLDPVYKFKAHPGDAYILQSQEKPEVPGAGLGKSAPSGAEARLMDEVGDPLPSNVALAKSLNDLYLIAKLIVGVDELKKGESDTPKEGEPQQVQALPPKFVEVHPTQFEAAVNAHPHHNLTDQHEQRDYTGRRAFLSDDGKAGYTLGHDGHLTDLFSHTTEHKHLAVQDALTRGARYGNAVQDGHIPGAYSRFGLKDSASGLI